MFPLTLPLLPLFIKKGSVKKRKTRTNRSRFFEIALDGGRERENGKVEKMKILLGTVSII